MQSYVTSQEAAKLSWEKTLLSVDPEIYEVLSDPFGEKAKQASLRNWYSRNEKERDSSEWLAKFRQTPFFQKAVDILQRQIQNQAQYNQLEEQEDQLQKAEEPLREQRRLIRRQDEALEMEKEMLVLELESWLQQQQQLGQAPVEDPVLQAQQMGMDPAQIELAQQQGQAKAASDARTLFMMRKIARNPVSQLASAASNAVKSTSPSAWQRLNAFGRAVAEHGFRPGAFDGTLKALGDAALPMGAMGALGGVATKRDDESYLGSALKGGLGGAALGAGGALVGKGLDFHNRVKDVQKKLKVDYGTAASGVANQKLLTPEGRRAVRQDLRDYQAQNAKRLAESGAAHAPAHGAAPQVPAASTPAPQTASPHSVAPPASELQSLTERIPDLQVPSRPVSRQAPSDVQSLIDKVPELQVPPAAAPVASAPAVAAASAVKPATPPPQRILAEDALGIMRPGAPPATPAPNLPPNTTQAVPPTISGAPSGPATVPSVPSLEPPNQTVRSNAQSRIPSREVPSVPSLQVPANAPATERSPATVYQKPIPEAFVQPPQSPVTSGLARDGDTKISPVFVPSSSNPSLPATQPPSVPSISPTAAPSLPSVPPTAPQGGASPRRRMVPEREEAMIRPSWADTEPVGSWPGEGPASSVQPAVTNRAATLRGVGSPTNPPPSTLEPLGYKPLSSPSEWLEKLREADLRRARNPVNYGSPVESSVSPTLAGLGGRSRGSGMEAISPTQRGPSVNLSPLSVPTVPLSARPQVIVGPPSSRRLGESGSVSFTRQPLPGLELDPALESRPSPSTYKGGWWWA